MSTITIQRSVLLNLIDHQLAQLKRIDGAEGMTSSPLTRYLTVMRRQLETAQVVIPVEDDIIHEYHCGVDLDTRLDRLKDEVKAAGLLTPGMSMAIDCREPA